MTEPDNGLPVVVGGVAVASVAREQPEIDAQ